ncbi:MAG TPA: YceI family protein [Myxococcales bacterium]|nr:YceI family protein [Myxococcales bacterium]
MAALLALALGAAPLFFQLAPGVPQTVRYHVSYTFHDVTGVAHRLTGRARFLPSGELEAELEAPVRAFSSGNAARDGDALGAVGADRFPTVTVRAVVPHDAQATGKATADLEVTLHGVPRRLEAPVEIDWQSPERAHVTGHFTLQLSDFALKRPVLFFIPISNALPIDFDLTWSAVPPA